MRDVAGKPEGFRSLAMDVSEHKQAERAIRDNERHLRLIAENIHDIIWTMDFDFRYTYISPSCFTISGYKPEEVISMPLETQSPPLFYAKMKKILTEELAKEQAGYFPAKDLPFSFEYKILRKDGRKIWVEISASFNRDENGKPFEIVGITRDISERKKAEGDA